MAPKGKSTDTLQKLESEAKALIKERDALRKAVRLSEQPASVRYGLVHTGRRQYPIGRLCRAIGVARAGYYGWLHGTGKRRAEADDALLKEIRRIYKKSGGRYGSPRVYQALREEGISCGKARVERLMRAEGFTGRSGPK